MVIMPPISGRCALLAKIALLLAVAAAGPHTQSLQGQSSAPETPERTARMRWFREAKFGLFIHWGLYADPAHKKLPVKQAGEVVTVTLPAKAPSELDSVLCLETKSGSSAR
jgi:hypothetical protein